MAAPHIVYEDLAIHLARALPRDPVATSLLRAFSSDAGWSPRQVRKVEHMLREAGRRVEPAPLKSDRGHWWYDTSRERQALRGHKRGIVHRYRHRHRDASIVRRHRKGQSLRSLAAFYGLTHAGVRYIVNRAKHGLDLSRRKVMSTTNLKVRDVTDFLKQGGKRTIRKIQGSYPLPVPIQVPGTERRIHISLCRWLRLDSCRSAQRHNAIQAATWLNNREDRPLRRRRLATIVRDAIEWRDNSMKEKTHERSRYKTELCF